MVPGYDKILYVDAIILCSCFIVVLQRATLIHYGFGSKQLNVNCLNWNCRSFYS